MSFEVKQVIEESAHYRLAVVKLPDVPVDVYGVINKTYGVCEMSVSVFPQAKESFAQFNKWMDDSAKGADVLPDVHDVPPNGGLVS